MNELTLSQPGAGIDGGPDGLRVLCVGAHQDDVEMLAMDAILAEYDHGGFGAVIVTNGAGSPRTGDYAHMSDEEMVEQRQAEQREAARLGRYGLCARLMYPSAAVKRGEAALVDELAALLARCAPETVIMHNLFDRHSTHVAVALCTIAALRRLPEDKRPARVIGVELWRGLDWLPNRAKLVLPYRDRDGLAERLVGVFRSQISGGKRYDLAFAGRTRANATFLDAHTTDDATQCLYGVDMTELLRGVSVEAHCARLLSAFADEVSETISAIQAKTGF